MDADARGTSASESTVPAEIKLRRAEQQLIIRWRDGHTTTLDAATLRQNCPCAACKVSRDQAVTSPPGRLNIMPNIDPKLTGAELMGHYAIRLTWSDGHNTGIYDYRYLRALTPSTSGLAKPI